MFRCPCCGYLTIPAPLDCAIAFICPVCCWENDVFLKSPEELDEPSDENGGITLREARANFHRFGAGSERLAKMTRPPTAEERQ